MDAIYLHKSDYLDHTPTADVAAGAVVLVGDLVLVAVRPIPANTLGALAAAGVFNMAKVTTGGSAIAAGASVYWDAGNKVVTTNANGGANKYAGKAILASVDADSTQRVALGRMPGVQARASAAQAALTAYGAGANGLAVAGDMAALVAMVAEIRATLIAAGLWKGAA